MCDRDPADALSAAASAAGTTAASALQTRSATPAIIRFADARVLIGGKA